MGRLERHHHAVNPAPHPYDLLRDLGTRITCRMAHRAAFGRLCVPVTGVLAPLCPSLPRLTSAACLGVGQTAAWWTLPSPMLTL